MTIWRRTSVTLSLTIVFLLAFPPVVNASSLMSEPLPNDLASTIIDPGTGQSNIVELDHLKLTSGTLVKTPWADSYWPVYKGLIGIRYSDPDFPNSKDFSENLKYVTKNPAAAIAASGNPGEINILSPAEKYDLLVGDPEWTLTKFAWQQGIDKLAKGEPIPAWTGICNGWSAAASQGEVVPQKAILVNSANNIAITFYPSDVKALLSVLWANASPPTRFAGTKCGIQNPPRDPNGRIINPACLDNNPATFHLAVTNQLGMNHRSFVMDATNNDEVWNYPLSSYHYSYFNPETSEPTEILTDAIISITDFSSDIFKATRGADTKFIVGIIMEDTYVVEMSPSHTLSAVSPLSTARHYYDLELDANYKIVGGEWYSILHPDFLWTYDAKALAVSVVDNEVSSADWKAQALPPSSWTTFAQTASARGQPMRAVIQALLAREPK